MLRLSLTFSCRELPFTHDADNADFSVRIAPSVSSVDLAQRQVSGDASAGPFVSVLPQACASVPPAPAVPCARSCVRALLASARPSARPIVRPPLLVPFVRSFFCPSPLLSCVRSFVHSFICPRASPFVRPRVLQASSSTGQEILATDRVCAIVVLSR